MVKLWDLPEIGLPSACHDVTSYRLYIFFGSAASRAWSICAGLLTGPGLPFLGILLWPFPAPGGGYYSEFTEIHEPFGDGLEWFILFIPPIVILGMVDYWVCHMIF